MKKINKQVEILFCVTVVALGFAFFSACERSEPEPEPPTPPVVDTDTLPTNKFVGTWVLCGVSSENEEPPCGCLDSLNTVDTLIFTQNDFLIHKHGNKTYEYFFDVSKTFLLYEKTENHHGQPFFVRHTFRNDGHELVLSGDFRNIQGEHLCFVKINSGEQPVIMPHTYHKLDGIWVSQCWEGPSWEWSIVDPYCDCESPWHGDTIVFTGNTMLRKDNRGLCEEYFFENTATHLIYYRQGVNRVKPIDMHGGVSNMTVFWWQRINTSLIEQPYYNVCFKKNQNNE